MMDHTTRREIEWDCNQLVLNFYGFLDEKRYDELAELFAEDGAWVRLNKELKGRQKIRDAMNERSDWLTAHLVSNVRIDIVDADHASSTLYVTLYRHEGWDAAAGPAPVVLPLAVLRTCDQLVREAGAWKFQRKTSREIMLNRK
jgi:hypothetical protein